MNLLIFLYSKFLNKYYFTGILFELFEKCFFKIEVENEKEH